MKIDCKKFLNNNSSNLTSEVEFKISGDKTTMENNLFEFYHDVFNYVSEKFDINIKSRSLSNRINFCGKKFQYEQKNISVDLYIEPELLQALAKKYKEDKNSKDEFIKHVSSVVYENYIEPFNIKNPIGTDYFYKDFEKVLVQNKSHQLYFNNWMEYVSYSLEKLVTDKMKPYFTNATKYFYEQSSKSFVKKNSLFLNNSKDTFVIKNLIPQEIENIKDTIKDNRFYKQCYLHDNLNKNILDSIINKYSADHTKKYKRYLNFSVLNSQDKNEVLGYMTNNVLNELYDSHVSLQNQVIKIYSKQSQKP